MTEKEYSDDQIVQVQRIKSCKDYYEVLQVSKDASDADLKKNYRKLALQLHPDKNKAPGAAEAFKAVGNAFAILSDKDKRRQYDLYGSETEESPTPFRSGYYGGNSGYYYEFSRGFESNISAEDLFSMFFGNEFASSNVYVRRNRARQARQAHQEDYSARSLFLQLLPLLLLLVISLFSQLMVSDPSFSLHRTSKYMYERHTARLNVMYFVKESFIKEYRDVLERIESEVEEEYLMQLKQNCYKERNHREAMLFKARHFKDLEMERNAYNIRLPSCTKLQEVLSKFSS